MNDDYLPLARGKVVTIRINQNIQKVGIEFFYFIYLPVLSLYSIKIVSKQNDLLLYCELFTEVSKYEHFWTNDQLDHSEKLEVPLIKESKDAKHGRIYIGNLI